MFPHILSVDRTVFISLIGSTLAASTTSIAPTTINVLSSSSTTISNESSITSSNSVDGLLNGTDFFMNLTSTATTSNHYRTNESTIDGSDEPIKKDFVFDRTDVRVIFITMYTLVFCCCFFGEYLCIIFVVTNRSK